MQLGLSTCPNDTFIFYGLLEKKIAFEFDIEPFFADVEILNQKSINEELDFCKISIAAYSKIADNYGLFSTGGAMGHNCGPLLLSDQKISANNKENDIKSINDGLKGKKILVPGLNTTAVLYLKLAFPEAKDLEPMLFSDIMPTLAQHKAPYGLIIHESRFTFPEFGLHQVIDLGEWWEQTTKHPIPLGGIVYHRKTNKEIALRMQSAIKKSIGYAWQNQEETLEYCAHYAQEMDPKVMLQHIQLYVNEYSLDMGDNGHGAIHYLFQEAYRRGLIDKMPQGMFIV